MANQADQGLIHTDDKIVRNLFDSTKIIFSAHPHCFDALNKIPACGVGVISSPSVCNVCVFHPTVFSIRPLFV